MNNRLKNYGLLMLAYLTWITFNYNPQPLLKLTSPHWGWIFSSCASILITRIIRLRNSGDWKKRLGINFTKNDIIGFLTLTMLLLLPLYFLVDHLISDSGYKFEALILHYKKYFGPDFPVLSVSGLYFYYLFQTFNEEMLIGAVLLKGLERRFRKLDRNCIVVFVALTFSLMHQVLPQLIPGRPVALLTFTSIISLFFVGIFRNALIVKTRKIALSWAVHLSFNLIFFASAVVVPNTTNFPTGQERFNIVFGNSTMFFLTGILAGASLIWLNSNRARVAQAC